ncbi:hypothetical protein RB653_009185 [Dictyostelium firmibasis]|uniref:EGF-like domain-containing protein n=1 Tax=Dictyostelium firmibasis TaxID=79012 RepID=A0AAN7YX63_9MYCE
MNELSNLFVFLFLFIFLFFSSFNNAQFIPITPETTLSALVIDPIYSFVPLYSNFMQCFTNKFDILIEVSSGFSITGTLTNDTGYYFSLKKQIDNKYLYGLNSNYAPTVGSYVQEITFTTNDTNTHIYQLMSTCNDFKTDNLNITSILKPFYLGGTFYYYISVTGIEPAFPKSIGTSGSVQPVFTYLGGSAPYNYMVQMTPDFSNNITQDIEVTLAFNGNRFYPFKFKSYYAQFSEQDLPTIHVLDYFPPNILSTNYNYTQFGYGCNPVLQSNMNSNITRPFQYITSSNGNSYMVPIKGKKGNITYSGAISQNSSFYSTLGIFISSLSFTPNIKVYEAPSIGVNSFYISSIIDIDIPLYVVGFTNTIPYQYTDYSYSYFINFVQSWPYGFISGNNTLYTHKVTLVQSLVGSLIVNNYYSFGIDGKPDEVSEKIIPLNYTTTILSKLLSYQFTRISSYKYLLTLNIESVNGVRNIFFSQKYSFIDTLVSGSIYNGTFEVIISPFEIGFIAITDLVGNYMNYDLGDVISINPIVTLQIPMEMQYKLNMSSFNNITFLNNDLDLVTDSYNVAYIESDEIPQDIPMAFLLIDTISFPIDRDITDFATILYRNPFTYNNSSKKFESKFILPKNNMFGDIQYIIEYGPSTSAIYSNELTNSLFAKDTELDNQGPIFRSIEKIGNGSIISTTGTVGWKFNITDDLNGFESGYIKVMGSVDSSTYEFNFTINNVIGDKFNCQYQIKINISEPCISQEYRIVRVILFDTNKIASRFNQYFPTLPTSSIINPFINFLDVGVDEITVLPFTCPTPLSTPGSKPILLSFKSSTTTIDVGATNRTISFDFSIDPGVNGIKQDQLPIVYINSLFSGLVKCISTIISYNTNNVVYKCSTELPLGFGYPNALTFSLYGIVNNVGFFYGFSADDILNITNSNYYTNTTLSFGQPVIQSTNPYYSDDNSGELIIFGRGLKSISRIDFVYNDSTLSPNSATSINSYGSSVIKATGVKKTGKPFIIKAFTSSSFTSNEFTVKPIYYNATKTPTPTSTPTLTPIPTVTPIPTNAPQKCQGNPECGGKNQGYCSSAGCICYAPWIGLTCTSQIIIVPQPTINTTNPQTEIPTTPTDNNQTSSEESQKMIFKSLISLVSLRELNFNNEEVKNHIFDQWIYTPINQFKNQYFTTISSTNITVTLEWFNQTTSIEFANQNLTMNPSTIKYTIEITNYPFVNKLNQLQLVMSASLTLNSNDICSSNQFGNTSTGDDSNYLKIQIENHSLYGRFIKRAIIDNIVKSVNNVLLDSSLNVIDSSSSSLQSFIGITIPYYTKSIIVDPDFSVLIDSKSASDNDDSVCTKNKSGLTTSQLAGIIIGSVGFAAVIIITSVYFIVHRRNQKRFVASVNKKMNEMNNNK